MEKKNMVLGLLKSNNKLTYNDEKADEGLILHPYSWDSDAWRNIMQSLDKNTSKRAFREEGAFYIRVNSTAKETKANWGILVDVYLKNIWYWWMIRRSRELVSCWENQWCIMWQRLYHHRCQERKTLKCRHNVGLEEPRSSSRPLLLVQRTVLWKY